MKQCCQKLLRTLSTRRYECRNVSSENIELGTIAEYDVLWDGSQARIVSVFVGTWNMGNNPPPSNLHDWIQPGYDIYVVGSQECKYTPPPEFESFAHHWFHCVEAALPGYHVICTRSMWQNHVLCLASARLRPYIRDVESSQEETGVGHIAPNKGGVAISFFIGDTSLCVVSVHLAAREVEVRRRCDDISEIIRGMRLGHKLLGDAKPLTNQFTHVVWMGDLNFRIDMDAEEAEVLANTGNNAKLYEHDQLHKIRVAQQALYLFHEGEIKFPPTYKHFPGEGVKGSREQREYDVKKKHTPSWCDRVLWHSFPDTEDMFTLRPNSYASFPSVCSSDHSPVSAVFDMTLPPPIEKNAMTPRRDGTNDSVLQIKVSELRGIGLSAHHRSGKADTFVVFTSRCSSDRVITPVVKHTTEPEWLGQSFTLRAEPYFRSRAQLASWHLLVSTYDQESLHNDVTGHGVISLKSAAQGPALQSQPFIVYLSVDGKPAGTLQGEVQICMDAPTRFSRLPWGSQ